MHDFLCVWKLLIIFLLFSELKRSVHLKKENSEKKLYHIYHIKSSNWTWRSLKMADRLTQLQDAVNAQADNLCNSIGILQQTSQPSPLSGYGSSKTSHHNASDTDHTQLFAQMIARTGKDIEVCLPLNGRHSYLDCHVIARS